MRGWKPHLANFPAEIGERALRFQQGSHDLRIDAFLRVFAIHANPETAHAIANPVQTIGNRSRKAVGSLASAPAMTPRSARRSCSTGPSARFGVALVCREHARVRDISRHVIADGRRFVCTQATRIDASENRFPLARIEL
jgi:hypothetical protein